jgi:hypothetical protein
MNAGLRKATGNEVFTWAKKPKEKRFVNQMSRNTGTSDLTGCLVRIDDKNVNDRAFS